MLLPKIKEYSQLTKDKCILWIIRFYRIGTKRENSSREFQFLFASWFSLLLFFTFFVLAEKNPLNLLLPFNVFQNPHIDHRSEVKVFISDGDINQIPVQRRMLKNGDPEKFTYQLIGSVGSPPYFTLDESAVLKDKIFSPKKLLELQFALKKVWFRNDDTVMVLDWNQALLEKAMNEYRLPQIISSSNDSEEEPGVDLPVDTVTYYSGGDVSLKESDEVTRNRRLKALGATFFAIDASILMNFPKLRILQHKLDGVSQPLKGLTQYKLEEVKSRNR